MILGVLDAKGLHDGYLKCVVGLHAIRNSAIPASTPCCAAVLAGQNTWDRRISSFGSNLMNLWWYPFVSFHNQLMITSKRLVDHFQNLRMVSFTCCTFGTIRYHSHRTRHQQRSASPLSGSTESRFVEPQLKPPAAVRSAEAANLFGDPNEAAVLMIWWAETCLLMKPIAESFRMIWLWIDYDIYRDSELLRSMILPSPTTTMSFVGAGKLKQVGFISNPSIYQNDGPKFMSETAYSIHNAQDETKSRRGDGKETSGDQQAVASVYVLWCPDSALVPDLDWMGLRAFFGRMPLLVSSKRVSQLHQKRQRSRSSCTAVTLGV